MMRTDEVTTLEINGMKFHAVVGILPEETADGVDLKVDFKGKVFSRKAVEDDDIRFTPDVRDIAGIVAEEIAKPCNLLETLADRIVRAVYARFDTFLAIKVRVAKLEPGIYGAESWSATASLNWENENPGY